MNTMTELDTYKIRPAARILRTIGKDLIKDIHAAIIELVKNSYDADAINSNITPILSQLAKRFSLNLLTIFLT